MASLRPPPSVNATPSDAIAIQCHDASVIGTHLNRLEAYLVRKGLAPLSYHPAWLNVLRRGLGHVPYCLEAVSGGKTRGFLALAYLSSPLFGKYLVSLPYLNYGGAIADDEYTAGMLIDHAVELAQRCGVRNLELRHVRPVSHPALAETVRGKAHMRRALPASIGQLWDDVGSKVRNQIRKARKFEFRVSWGSAEQLDAFYAVFSQNMRDLGTPVYGRRLFSEILRQFPDRAEICVLRDGSVPISAALLLHGWGTTEVPSASSLRGYNHTCANMLMYWNLLERALERGQNTFDFGRSSPDSGTYHFKSHWGAVPELADWQFHVRIGSATDMRPNNPRYQRLIRIWKTLPVPLTRWLGPGVARGIP